MAKETELERLVIRLVGDGSSYQKMLQTAEATTASAVKSIAEQTRSIGNKLSLFVTAPLVAIAASARSQVSEYKSALSQMVGLVGLSEQTVEGFSKDIQRIAIETGKAPVELANAMFFITSAGLRGAAAVEALGVSAKAASAGLGGTQSVADAVTSAMNAYGHSNLSATRATELLTAAVRAGKAEASQFAPQLGQLLPLTSSMGIGFDQVAGSLAFLTKTTGNASLAATGLKGVLNVLVGGSKESIKNFEKMGFSLNDIQEMARKQGLPKTLMTIRKAAEKAGLRLNELFTDTEGLTAALQFTGAAAADAQQVFNDVANSAGIVDEAFTAAANTTKFQWAKAMAEFQVILIQIGEILVPLSTGMLDLADIGLATWRGLSAEGRKFIVIAGAIAASIGPTLIVLSRLPMVLGLVKSGFLVLISPAARLVNAFITIGSAVTTGVLRTGQSIFGWSRFVGQSFFTVTQQAVKMSAGVIVAVASLGARLRGQFSGLSFGDIWTSGIVKAKLWQTQVTSIVQSVIGTSKKFGAEAGYWLRRPYDYLVAVAPGLVQRVVSITTLAADKIKLAWLKVSGVGISAGQAIQSRWAQSSAAIASISKNTWQSVTSTVMRATQRISGASARLSQPALSAFSSLATKSQVIFSGIWSRLSPPIANIKQRMSPVVALFSQDAQRIARGFQIAATTIAPAFSAAGKLASRAVMVSMNAAFTAVKVGAKSAGTAIRSMGGGLMRIVDAIGTLSMVLASAGMATGFLGTLATIAPILLAVVPVVSIVGAAFAAVMSPVGLIIAGVSAIGLIIAKLVSNVDLSTMWTRGQESINEYVAVVSGFFANFEANMKMLYAWTSNLWTSFESSAIAVWNGVSGFIGNSISVILSYLAELSPNLIGLWDSVTIGASESWTYALEMVKWFFSSAVGFFGNFSQNMQILWQFMTANWRTVLADIGNMIKLTAQNMGSNFGVGVSIAYRLFLAFGGWLKGLLKGVLVKIFSVDMLNAAVSGLKKLVAVFTDMGSGFYELFKGFFTGATDGLDLNKMLDNAVKDIDAGAASINFADTAAKIISEESANLKSPLDGFTSQLTKLPEFNLEMGDGLALPKFITKQVDEASKVAEDASAGIGEAIPKGIGDAANAVDDATKSVKKFGDINAKATIGVTGVQGVARGTSEALSHIQEYLLGAKSPAPTLPGAPAIPGSPVTVGDLKKTDAALRIAERTPDISHLIPQERVAATTNLTQLRSIERSFALTDLTPVKEEYGNARQTADLTALRESIQIDPTFDINAGATETNAEETAERLDRLIEVSEMQLEVAKSKGGLILAGLE